MNEFTYLLTDEQFQPEIDSVIDTFLSMNIKSISDLGTHLGNIYFILCYALAGILTDDNNRDLRDKLIVTVEDMGNGKEEFVFFDYLYEFLQYCLSKQYITKDEFKFLSKFRFFYVHNEHYRIV